MCTHSLIHSFHGCHCAHCWGRCGEHVVDLWAGGRMDAKQIAKSTGSKERWDAIENRHVQSSLKR